MALYIGDTLIAGNIDGQQLNNPFSLLDYKYSEYELSNASWLLSNGQWNSGAVYQSVYDLLLQIYNGTVTKAGVSVKLSTETYADTDFVLNTTDTAFRLPLKVALASGNKVAGNGMALGLTNGTSNNCSIYPAALAGAANMGRLSASGAGTDAGSVAEYAAFTDGVKMGVSTDPTKSGIETSANGLYLYFYVGETVQDANIIAAGQALTDIADLKNASNFSSLGKETIVGWGMPDYSAGISVSNITPSTPYTAPSIGFLYCNFYYATIYVNNKRVALSEDTQYSQPILIALAEGDVVTITANAASGCFFYPCKGVN